MKTPSHISRLLPLAFAAFAVSGTPAVAQEKNFTAYPEAVSRYLTRLYGEEARPLAFRPDYPGGFAAWQGEARAALVRQLGIERIARSAGAHRPRVELGPPEDCGAFTRQRCSIETEPDVRIPFWLLQPKTPGPWPLGVFPHGHDTRGHDTTAGVYQDAAHERRSLAEDRDVAVQAVKLGFLAVAPAIRGVASYIIPDLEDRHGDRDCRSHVMHCLMAGRTASGERVWDMQRILDWALAQPNVDSRQVLMMGNSGGGMVTMFTAACDPRIGIAVPSCSFAPSVGAAGYIFHCDCNMVPGLMELGGLSGVVGLVAPRHLLAVNGRRDPLFSSTDIERGAAEVRSIYQAAGVPDRFQHRWGTEGHRFYQELMWPFVQDALRERSRAIGR